VERNIISPEVLQNPEQFSIEVVYKTTHLYSILSMTEHVKEDVIPDLMYILFPVCDMWKSSVTNVSKYFTCLGTHNPHYCDYTGSDSYLYLECPLWW